MSNRILTWPEVVAAFMRATKPRAVYSSAGIGYWVVRSVVDGTIIQGVDPLLEAAYHAWWEARECYLHVKS